MQHTQPRGAAPPTAIGHGWPGFLGPECGPQNGPRGQDFSALGLGPRLTSRHGGVLCHRGSNSAFARSAARVFIVRVGVSLICVSDLAVWRGLCWRSRVACFCAKALWREPCAAKASRNGVRVDVSVLAKFMIGSSFFQKHRR